MQDCITDHPPDDFKPGHVSEVREREWAAFYPYYSQDRKLIAWRTLEEGKKRDNERKQLAAERKKKLSSRQVDNGQKLSKPNSRLAIIAASSSRNAITTARTLGNTGKVSVAFPTADVRLKRKLDEVVKKNAELMSRLKELEEFKKSFAQPKKGKQPLDVTVLKTTTVRQQIIACLCHILEILYLLL